MAKPQLQSEQTQTDAVLKSQPAVVESLQLAITQALHSGMSAERIQRMTTTLQRAVGDTNLNDIAAALSAMLDADDDDPAPTTPGELPLYETLPPGLIDLPSASRKYGVNLRTIRSWVRRGHVEQVGLLKAPARGGGYIVVDEAAFIQYMSTPRRLGRPTR